jgi:dihydrofolate reductase
MILSLIAALAEDSVIGSAAGGVPWDHPRDRAHFRARTAARWLLVGRRTYGEMEGWFGERVPIVLSRSPGLRLRHPSHRLADSVAAALTLAEANGVGELIVCGGAAVYEAAMPHANRLLLTRIDLRTEVAEPVRFPRFDTRRDWRLVHAERWPGEDGCASARYEIYERGRHSALAPQALPG